MTSTNSARVRSSRRIHIEASESGPANRANGLGLFYTVYYAVGAFGPPLAGLLRDRYGTAAAAILCAAALFAAGAPLLWLFSWLAAMLKDDTPSARSERN